MQEEYTNVITLTDSDGSDVDFEVLDIVPYKEHEYVVMLPVDDESDSPEAVILELLEAEGAEAVMPDLLDFLLYCFYNSNFKADNLGGKRSTAHLCNMGISLLEYFRRTCRRELERSTHFLPPARIQDLASMAKHYVSLGNQTGEGWFLTGEMLELIHSGTTNIICTQPFGCLPNHIAGKGMIRKIREVYPQANIVSK